MLRISFNHILFFYALKEWTKTPFRLWIETGRRKDDRPNRPTYYYDWQCFGLAKSETEPNVLCISYANPKEKHRLILSIDDSNQFADYYNYLRSVLPRASPCCRFFNKCTKKASKIGGALWRYVNFERRTAKAGRSRSDADPKGAKLSASTPIAAQTRALNKDTIDDDFGQYFQGAQEPRAWRTTGCPGR